MSQTLGHRDWLSALALAAGASAFGVLIALQPFAAVGLLMAVGIAALAFLAPVTHLSILVFLTTIVPYSINNRYLGAGQGAAGLLLSDLFLFTGLARAALVLLRVPLDRRRLTALVLVAAFGLWAVLSAYIGLRADRSVSDVGVELRALLGFAATLLALAVLVERATYARLARGLVALGLLLGLWGVAQWVVGFSFESDFGVRAGVRYATQGRGQVQGGLFAFPVAVVTSAAALMSGEVRARGARLAVVAVLGLNAASLLLTFERTFWVATVLGVVFVVVRTGRARRLRAILWTAIVAVVGMAAMSAFSPSTLQTARERLLSIGQYGSDDSLRYRRVESAHVSREIAAAPITGSGLAATIWWGQPWNGVPPAVQKYTHNGYLWVVWRLGLIGTVLLLSLFATAISRRGPPDANPLWQSIQVGSQASLLALLVASITFPTFNGTGITTAMGVLIAVCLLPRSTSYRPMHGPPCAPEKAAST